MVEKCVYVKNFQISSRKVIKLACQCI